jgi:hypothetical protein
MRRYTIKVIYHVDVDSPDEALRQWFAPDKNQSM